MGSLAETLTMDVVKVERAGSSCSHETGSGSALARLGPCFRAGQAAAWRQRELWRAAQGVRLFKLLTPHAQRIPASHLQTPTCPA